MKTVEQQTVEAVNALRRKKKEPRVSDNEASASSSGKPALRTTCAATVRPKPLRWLVPEMLPLGKLVLLAGDGGLGKSSITVDLAARLSHGQSAFGLHYPASCGDTLIVSCEDDPADTIIPRLMAAGADRHHVHFLDGVETNDGRPAPFSLAHYAALDAHLAANPAIRLVTIDPASAFAGLAGIDGHKDAELRALLGPLTEVAARYETTIILVCHLSKGDSSKAARRVLGSVAWVNAVRAAWVVAEREQDRGKRLLLPIKANLAPRRSGLMYTTIPLSLAEQDLALAECQHLNADDRRRLADQLFRVCWHGQTDAEADQVFAEAARRPEAGSDIDKAKEWLKQRLGDGPVPSNVCVQEGNDELGIDKGLKWWREMILKDRLAGKTRLKGFGPDGVWFFTLPDHNWPPDREDDPSTPDSLDSLDSLHQTEEQNPSILREIHREGRESNTAWHAPGLSGDDTLTPFE